MMVLDRIHPLQARLTLRELPVEAPYGASTQEEVEVLLRSMGFYFDLETTSPPPTPSPHQDRVHIVQEWDRDGSTLRYQATVSHDPAAMQLLDPFAAAALSTYGPRSSPVLTDLRLAIYELCQNILEHGRTVRTHPTIRISLCFDRDSIGGAIEDDCAHFDPLGFPEQDIDEHAARRRRRGYGLTLVRRAVDRIDYTAIPQGNRIEFQKRIPR